MSDEKIALEAIGASECHHCGGSRLLCCPSSHAIMCLDCATVTSPETVAQELKSRPNSGIFGRRTTQNAESIEQNNNHPGQLADRNTFLDKANCLIERWQKSAKVSDQTEKNIAFALSEITRIASHLYLSSKVLRTASELYKLVTEKKLTKGRSIRGFCAAVSYAAYRQCGYIRTLDEVARASKIDKKEIGYHYRVLVKELDCLVPPVNLSQQVPRLLHQLSVEGKTAEIVYKILKAAEELKLTSGKEPAAIMSASVYIAARLVGEKKTQREISEVARVTETSIRNRYKELEKRLEFIIAV